MCRGEACLARLALVWVDRREHPLNRSIVPEGLALVRKPVLIARREHECRAKLERVFAELLLRESAGFCSLARGSVVAAQ